jgi:hypothetical protein
MYRHRFFGKTFPVEALPHSGEMSEVWPMFLDFPRRRSIYLEELPTGKGDEHPGRGLFLRRWGNFDWGPARFARQRGLAAGCY